MSDDCLPDRARYAWEDEFEAAFTLKGCGCPYILDEQASVEDLKHFIARLCASIHAPRIA